MSERGLERLGEPLVRAAAELKIALASLTDIMKDGQFNMKALENAMASMHSSSMVLIGALTVLGSGSTTGQGLAGCCLVERPSRGWGVALARRSGKGSDSFTSMTRAGITWGARLAGNPRCCRRGQGRDETPVRVEVSPQAPAKVYWWSVALAMRGSLESNEFRL